MITVNLRIGNKITIAPHYGIVVNTLLIKMNELSKQWVIIQEEQREIFQPTLTQFGKTLEKYKKLANKEKQLYKDHNELMQQVIKLIRLTNNGETK